MSKNLSLRKCRHVYKDAILRHKQLSKRLSSDLLGTFENSLDSLGSAIQNNDIENARLHAFEVQEFLLEHGKKSLFEQIREFSLAIIFALIIAAIVRQMWFELYEIPSGSMRPTFLEGDRVLVFKDAFCINKPLETAHFYFDPKYVERGSIVVITGDEIPFPDVDTVYFGLFPGKRRYVKRCVAKDGDKLYFYGGKIYGIDKYNKPLVALLDSPLFSQLEYIPFITFDGKVDQASDNAKEHAYIIRHMNIPVAKVSVSRSGVTNGVPIGSTHPFGQDWGLDNFGISRLLEPDDLPKAAAGYQKKNANLYLEIKHSPSLPSNQRPDANGQPALLTTELSWMALDNAACQKIKESMYTARFYVRKGTCFRYTPEGPDLKGRGILLDRQIPDGCYEFLDGKAYEIGWGAISYLLPESHPIYPRSLKALKALYNSGIDFSMSTNVPKKNSHFPARYSYYRDGTLYILGKPLFQKDHPALINFLNNEQNRQAQQKGYTPFVDKGPPIKDGLIDIAFIQEFGLSIQDSHYLLLGDNHAMSNDSRFVGAIPQKNLQGSPALIFWPTGDRWGRPPQPRLPWFRVSNVVVVSSAALLTWLSYAIYNRRTSRRTYDRTRAKRLKEN